MDGTIFVIALKEKYSFLGFNDNLASVITPQFKVLLNYKVENLSAHFYYKMLKFMSWSKARR